MATFVLVHGGWGGAHSWRLVRRRLHEVGHEVFTPSLTGIGERVHLTGPGVDLSTHVLDVVNAVLYEDLTDVVLVGFSYGGFVVTGSLEHIADRVRHLVYLDAFVPADGDTVWGLVGRPVDRVVRVGQEWLVGSPPRQFEDPAEEAFALPRRTAHPVRCFTEPVRLDQPLEDFPFSRAYIRATGDAPDAPGVAAFEAAAQRAKSSPAWTYHEIATTHLVPSNRPAELTEVLLEVVAGG
jgi:pimeloyl-ACP methyl ester carboxylesterase